MKLGSDENKKKIAFAMKNNFEELIDDEYFN